MISDGSSAGFTVKLWPLIYVSEQQVQSLKNNLAGKDLLSFFYTSLFYAFEVKTTNAIESLFF